MAINYAEKYSTQIDERFKLGAVTTPAVNASYDFVGVKTVKVYSLPTVEMGDYVRSGLSRYGNPQELQDSLQELTMTRDRSFTFTIDKGNDADQMGIKNAGAALQRQLDEVVIPEIDIYRLKTICNGAGTTSSVEAITSDNAFEAFLTGTATLTDLKAPRGGRLAYVTPTFYKNIKLDPSFVKNGDLSQNMLLNGQVGQVDGVPIILVPTSYLPTGVEFVITNPIACTAPTKLAEYKIHQDPPGINGNLVEGRVYYDAFILNNKKNAIYVHRSAAPSLESLTVNSEAGTSSGTSKITVSPSEGPLFYKTAASTAPSVSYGTDLSGWTSMTSGEEITATNGHKITVARGDSSNKAVASGTATITSAA